MTTDQRQECWGERGEGLGTDVEGYPQSPPSRGLPLPRSPTHLEAWDQDLGVRHVDSPALDRCSHGSQGREA